MTSLSETAPEALDHVAWATPAVDLTTEALVGSRTAAIP